MDKRVISKAWIYEIEHKYQGNTSGYFNRW
jgi:hypothetical protein